MALSQVRDVLSLIIAENLKLVVRAPGDEPLCVPVTITNASASHGGVDVDDDFEPIEVEAGESITVRCHGDSGVRRFFRFRSIIDGETWAPREHEWAFEHGRGEEAEAVTFKGRLYDYGDRTISPNKAYEMWGRIRIAR